MEDTLQTVRGYEAARLEYDAYRFDMESLQSGPRTDAKIQQINDLETELVFYKEKYEKLKKDVQVKIRFLDDNRVNVMKKQLILFQEAIAAYFAGNHKALEASMKQFNAKLTRPEVYQKFQSFLEQS